MGRQWREVVGLTVAASLVLATGAGVLVGYAGILVGNDGLWRLGLLLDERPGQGDRQRKRGHHDRRSIGGGWELGDWGLGTGFPSLEPPAPRFSA